MAQVRVHCGGVCLMVHCIVDAMAFDECPFLIESFMYHCWYFGDRIKEWSASPTVRSIPYALTLLGTVMAIGKVANEELEEAHAMTLFEGPGSQTLSYAEYTIVLPLR
ncbi:conserved hypothetical protein [Ricinus communis]|uniref:Uncharacterized protein n=1 Tax=Ricinus communis TaxID=3988 RepID=B9RSC2_RICCO|nr:conserved hypothetical protein [Ricinus communis]